LLEWRFDGCVSSCSKFVSAPPYQRVAARSVLAASGQNVK
jgi:hypothetical protein